MVRGSVSRHLRSWGLQRRGRPFQLQIALVTIVLLFASMLTQAHVSAQGAPSLTINGSPGPVTIVDGESFQAEGTGMTPNTVHILETFSGSGCQESNNSTVFLSDSNGGGSRQFQQSGVGPFSIQIRNPVDSQAPRSNCVNLVLIEAEPEPTETPIPTEVPTETPVPTDAPTETPVPTEDPTEVPTEEPPTPLLTIDRSTGPVTIESGTEFELEGIDFTPNASVRVEFHGAAGCPGAISFFEQTADVEGNLIVRQIAGVSGATISFLFVDPERGASNCLDIVKVAAQPTETPVSTEIPDSTETPVPTIVSTEPAEPTATSVDATGSAIITLTTEDGSDIPDGTLVCLDSDCLDPLTTASLIASVVPSGFEVPFGELEPGSYTLAVFFGNEQVFAETIEIVAGEVTEVTVVLPAADDPATPTNDITPTVAGTEVPDSEVTATPSYEVTREPTQDCDVPVIAPPVVNPPVVQPTVYVQYQQSEQYAQYEQDDPCETPTVAKLPSTGSGSTGSAQFAMLFALSGAMLLTAAVAWRRRTQ